MQQPVANFIEDLEDDASQNSFTSGLDIMQDENIVATMIKHFLDSNLDQFSKNYGNFSEEQREGFY